MKRLSESLVCFGFLFLGFMPGPDDLEGVWLTAKKDSKIEIVQNGDGTFSGKVIWVIPSESKFDGKPVLKGVTYDKDTGSYTCPWIYDPRIGITACGTARVSGDTLYLKARKGIFTKDEIFTRVK